jgi:hypothetical protein
MAEGIYSPYFWKGVAHNGIVPGSGVFLACAWVGWMEKRDKQTLKTATSATAA